MSDDLQGQLRELERENKRLKIENEKLSRKLQDAVDRRDELLKENRELKLRPVQRTYIDPEDERESTAWREKATNLLALLDNLQHDMQNDLRDLEAETFAPGSTSFTAAVDADQADTANASSNNNNSTEPAAAAPAESSRKRKHRKKASSNTADASPAPAPAATTAAAESSSPKKRRRKPATDDDVASLDAGYKLLNTAAKYMHTQYKKVKELMEDSPSSDDVASWKMINETIKKSAKSAKAVALKNDVQVSPERSDFVDNYTRLTGDVATWIEASYPFADNAGSDNKSDIESATNALQEALDLFVSTAKKSSMNSGSSLASHGKAAQALSDAMRQLVAAETSVFGV